MVEYTEPLASSTPSFSKSYTYAGSRLLATSSSVGTRIHHPDRLGTGAISTPSINDYVENSTLPFGTALDGETYGGNNQVFTSYDRSGGTGLDYAVNRTYSQGQSRFTQVDPIGMAAASMGDPQSANLYSYTRNSVTDLVDPSGLQMIAFTMTVCSSWERPEDRVCVEVIIHWMYIPDGSSSSSGGGGGGGGYVTPQSPANPPPPCGAKLTGDSEVDEVARVLFGESDKGYGDTYDWMRDTLINRYRMSIKEFGCSLSEVLRSSSAVYKDQPEPYRTAETNQGLKGLDPGRCAAYQMAQQRAQEVVNATKVCGVLIGKAIFGNSPNGNVPLFWAASTTGDNPSNGRHIVGDTAFRTYFSGAKDNYYFYLNKSTKGRGDPKIGCNPPTN